MQALAVRPPHKNSVHLADLPQPKLADIPGGRGVLVRTLQVGVDATDAEINEGLYGRPPEGFDFLVLGHEVFGVVEAVGPGVKDIQPGDLCTCTVRRPGPTLYDDIGRNDITGSETYYERGINLRHGFMTERFVDDAEFIVKVPQGLKHVGVLSEPASVCAKAIEQAYLAQLRMQVWEPKRAFVCGAGQIGLLTTIMLRLRGLEVYTIARTPNPGLKEEIVNACGATYISTQEEPLTELAKRVGRPDLIVEATGSSRIAFECMQVLNLNGVLVWTSVTGGGRSIDNVPADRINLEWVLGNKLLVGSVNGNRDHFAKGLGNLAMAELTWPGLTQRILTHRVEGFGNPAEIMRLLTEEPSALKVYVNIADL